MARAPQRRRSSHSLFKRVIRHEVGARPVALAVSLPKHAVTGEAELRVSRLGPSVVGEAVEIQAFGAEGSEPLVKDEAEEGHPDPLSGPGDGDALEVEVAVSVAEAAQDREGLD